MTNARRAVADLGRPEVVLVRPGETEWSRSGRHTSRTDLTLTELGGRQARQVGSLLAGRNEGRTRFDIRRDVPDWTVWTHGSPDGETLGQVGRRADRVLAASRGVAGGVLVFGHGQMLRVLAARWCGLPPIGGRVFALVDPGSESVLGHDHESAVVRRWNESSPLDCGQDPMPDRLGARPTVSERPLRPAPARRALVLAPLGAPQ